MGQTQDKTVNVAIEIDKQTKWAWYFTKWENFTK